ncbi:MAG: shikimate kinase [Pelagibacteraceae bacterium]|nr:shikimate kinase [Pelagibacteraceae bacterium]
MLKDFNSKICLIGMPGSGKTTIGRDLAKLIGYKFLDMDETIKKETHSTISEIFKKKGEKYFRNLEREIFKNVLALKDKLVISTGGGIILNNANELNKTYNIYLKCNYDTLYKRLLRSRDRPLIKDNLKENLKKLLNERKNKYSNIADIIIDANSLKRDNLNSILKEIKK